MKAALTGSVQHSSKARSGAGQLYPYKSYNEGNWFSVGAYNTASWIYNQPLSLLNLTADAHYGTGNLLAPNSGGIENFAMTTPVPLDNFGAVGVKVWSRISLHVAAGREQRLGWHKTLRHL